MRALLVEDDVSTVMLQRFLLEKLMFEVLTTDNVIDALALIEEGNVDLVILDILLPGQSGEVLLWELCNRFPDLPILVVSAHVDIQGKESSLMTSTPRLAKPFTQKQFSEAIEQVVKRS